MPRFNRTLVILHFLSHPQYRPPQHDPRLDEPETLRLLLLWLSQRNHPHILDSDLMKEFVALTGAIRPALDSILRLMKTIDEVIEKCMEQQGPRPRDVFHSQLRVDSSMILRINVELMMARRALMDLERLIAAQAYMRGILRELAYMIDRYTLEIEEFLRHSANQSAERKSPLLFACECSLANQLLRPTQLLRSPQTHVPLRSDEPRI